MSGEERRTHILQYLSHTKYPVSGNKLAREFGVSRQVIVQDIARLRSAHVPILSTNRGYIVPASSSSGCKRIFKCRHTDEQAEDELNSIVDQGGVVLDVFVNHKTYGRLQADMHIRCRRDVKEYLGRIHSGKSSLLKNITSDYHYHTVSADSDEILDEIEAELGKRGILIKKKELMQQKGE